MKSLIPIAALVLLLLTPAILSAQMYSAQPYYPPSYSQPGYAQPTPYASQYAPAPRPAYSQPQQPYAQPYPQQQPSQGYGYNQPQQSYPQQPYQNSPQQQYPQQGYAPAQPQSLSADQLEQLVAPIALYPDTLVAEVLAASTYPAQVSDADRWLQSQGNASPYQIAGGADVQNWDPSVKALTAFPQVLAELDRNQRWTTYLGNAYYNQPQDVLEAVQIMRQRAQAAGNLQSTPQEQVSYDQGAIELAPPNPQMVYVPTYNPWSVYGDPVTPYPGFNLLGAIGSFFNSGLGSNALQYGLGIAMAAFNHTPWGWLGWGLNWLTHAILFDHNDYASHSTTVANWGLSRGSMYAFAGHGGMGYAQNYGRSGNGSRGGYGNGYANPTGPGSIARPRDNYAAAAPIERNSERYTDRYNRPEPQTNNRPPMEAYNRAPAPIARPETNNRPESRLAYGPSYYNNGGERGYTAPAQSYRAPTMQAYRSPSESFQRNDFAGRASDSYKPEKSGGFHLFGGGSKEPSFKEPSYKEPKFKQPSFKEPKMPKMSSGGGHSFSGGSHSSGHSSGGKHHG